MSHPTFSLLGNPEWMYEQTSCKCLEEDYGPRVLNIGFINRLQLNGNCCVLERLSAGITKEQETILLAPIVN